MIHQKRRDALLSQLENGACVILSTNPEQPRNGDVNFPFRAHSDFYYLTGFQEPESVAIFSKDNYTIFLRPRDEKREIWDGKRLGIDDAPKVLNADHAIAIEHLDKDLNNILSKATTVYFDNKQTKLDTIINNTLQHYKTKSYSPILHEMRLIKDEHEISVMKKAADISVKAHEKAMKHTKVGMYEYELQSYFDGYFTKNNTQHAYTPIVAGGANACVLHYIENNQPLKDQELVLIDAGCELDNYASDITRTFPINGTFSKAQKQIYQIVLNAQLAAIDSIKPGVNVHVPHQIASRIIKQGLIDLGVLQEGEDLTKFYMHGTGHWLGLDVHDVGEYKINKQHRLFEPGMVITVEPGIYIRDNDKINKSFHGIGIRIEDDVLVTKDGNTVLTGALAKTISEIESLMKN